MSTKASWVEEEMCKDAERKLKLVVLVKRLPSDSPTK